MHVAIKRRRCQVNRQHDGKSVAFSLVKIAHVKRDAPSCCQQGLKMAIRTKEQRASDYLKQLLAAKNKRLALTEIINHLETLTSTLDGKPLSRAAKLAILEELELQARRTVVIRESFGLEHRHKSTTASDNSNILDVISAMKGRYKG